MKIDVYQQVTDKSRDAAQDALWDMMSEISESEHPRIEKRGKNYYVITLEG